MGQSLSDKNVRSEALLHKYVCSKESHNWEEALENKPSQTQAQ